jgi:hypothetical protein
MQISKIILLMVNWQFVFVIIIICFITHNVSIYVTNYVTMHSQIQNKNQIILEYK